MWSALRLLSRLSAEQRLARANHQLNLTGLLVTAALDERAVAERQLRQADQAEQDACTHELALSVRRYLNQGGRTWAP